jgi:hypothetical protein
MRLFLLKVLKKFQQFALGGFLRSLFSCSRSPHGGSGDGVLQCVALLSAVLSAAPFVHVGILDFTSLAEIKLQS